MLGSAVLDTAIGLVFIYIMFSLLLTVIREEIERSLKTRAADLEEGIKQILHDPTGAGLTRLVYEHPLIFSLYKGKYVPSARTFTGARKTRKNDNLPNYIPARNFALALLDIFSSKEGDARTLPLKPGSARSKQVAPPSPLPAPHGQSVAQQRGATTTPLDTGRVAEALEVAIRMSGGDPVRLQLEIESWFNSTMDRVSGWYKRRTQRIILWISFLIAVFCNVDTLGLSRALAANQGMRDAFVAQVDPSLLKEVKGDERVAAVRRAQEDLQAIGLPIGWSRQQLERIAPDTVWDAGGWLSLLQFVLGCWLTALAISLGAPFWFDVLNRLMVIRATVKPHEKSPEEPSQDGGRPRNPDQPQRQTGRQAKGGTA